MLDRPLERSGDDRKSRPDPETAGLLTLPALLAAARRRRRAALLTMVLTPLLAWLALSQMTPRYTAAATVLYEPAEYTARELQSILRLDTSTDTVMSSQAEIARGLPVAESLADAFDLGSNPEFNTSLRPPNLLNRFIASAFALALDAARHILPDEWVAAPAPPPTVEAIRRATILTVQDAVTVKPVRASRVMEISFTAPDPVLAANAANAAANRYIAGQLNQKYDAVKRATVWLDERVGGLRADVRAADDRISRYRSEHGLLQGVQAGLGIEQISRLTADRLQARNDLAQAEARLDAARGRGTAEAAAAIAPSVVQSRAQLDAQEAQLQAMLARLGPAHPAVTALRDQVAALRRATEAEISRVVMASDADAHAARAKLAALDRALTHAQGQAGRDSQAEIALSAMEREAQAARGLLQSVLERIQETAQQAAIQTADARIISPAIPPLKPISPRMPILMAAATVCGVFFAFLLVWLLETADSSLGGGEDVRFHLGIPCFALLPHVPAGGKAGRIVDRVVSQPLSPFAEQMRALRAGLWLGPVSPKVVAITSARPGEGKTTVAVALGRTAALSGERVIVLDCDVRRPSLGRILGAWSSPGLIDCLTGKASLEQVIRHDSQADMDFISATGASSSAPPSNALALFMSDGMARLIAALRSEYDLVLLDLPPVFALADARVVARAADATVLCLRWRHTPRVVVRDALTLLAEAEAHVAGIALTKVDARVHARSGMSDAEVHHPRIRQYFQS